MSSLKAYTCCVMGERDLPHGEEQRIYSRIRLPFHEMVRDGVKYFGVGGNPGFERIMLEYLLRQRDDYRQQIRVIAVLPYPDYMRDWPAAEQKRQQVFLDRCDKVSYVADSGYPGIETDLGEKLADGSAFCLCYCHRTSETLSKQVLYAMESGLKVINACSWDLRQLEACRDWIMAEKKWSYPKY